jgi:hypothetical protein
LGVSEKPADQPSVAAAQARKIDCLLVWKLDRVRPDPWWYVRLGVDTHQKNQASRFLLHVLDAVRPIANRLLRKRSLDQSKQRVSPQFWVTLILMNPVKAFVARSFNAADDSKVQPVTELLESFGPLGLVWETAEQVELESVSKKGSQHESVRPLVLQGFQGLSSSAVREPGGKLTLRSVTGK